jgi:hypothetical protein
MGSHRSPSTERTRLATCSPIRRARLGRCAACALGRHRGRCAASANRHVARRYDARHARRHPPCRAPCGRKRRPAHDSAAGLVPRRADRPLHGSAAGGEAAAFTPGRERVRGPATRAPSGRHAEALHLFARAHDLQRHEPRSSDRGGPWTPLAVCDRRHGRGWLVDVAGGGAVGRCAGAGGLGHGPGGVGASGRSGRRRTALAAAVVMAAWTGRRLGPSLRGPPSLVGRVTAWGPILGLWPLQGWWPWHQETPLALNERSSDVRPPRP